MDAENTAVNENAWRTVIAALANDAARTAYARMLLGDADAFVELSPSRRSHTIDTLHRAGLIVQTPNGHSAVTDVFTRLLAETAPPRRPSGPQRFLRSDGRVDQYPAALGDREELLAFLADAAFPEHAHGQTYDETQVNERLAVYADDMALLRRHLVDHGLLERTPSGSTYRRADR